MFGKKDLSHFIKICMLLKLKPSVDEKFIDRRK